MKHLHSLLICLLLGACGEAREDYEFLSGVLKPNTAGFHPRAKVLAAMRPIPRQLEVGFPSRDLAGVMLLEVERNGVQTWLTADGATITLDKGFLTSTKGFGGGMAGSDIAQSAQLIIAGGNGSSERFHSFLNGNDEIELHAYRCRITSLGSDSVQLRGTPINTRKLQEDCSGLTQVFTNNYWIQESTGQMVQSSQWTGDFLGNIVIKTVPSDI